MDFPKNRSIHKGGKMEYAIVLLVGILVGFSLAFFLAKRVYGGESKVSPAEHEKLKLELAGIRATELRSKERTAQLETDLKCLSDKNTQAIGAWQSMKKESDLLKERLENQKKEFEEMISRLKDEFKNLANQVLLDNSQKFNQQTHEKLGDLLKPLKENIEIFGKKVESSTQETKISAATLKEHISSLVKMNESLQAEAKNLAEALRGDKKAQGDWGEEILEGILERSGLREGEEFFRQNSFKDEEGEKRPDVVVRLPGNRCVILDSKVSLNAYVSFYSTEDEKEKDLFLEQHANALRKHVKDLSRKNYQYLEGLNSPDFVLMFLHNEPALFWALQKDPALALEAYQQNILIVTPSSLMISLKMVSNIWRLEDQDRNAKEIARQSGLLLEKLGNFVGDLEKVGGSLTATQGHYDNAMKKLKTGKGNVLKKAGEIMELGATVSKDETKKRLATFLNEEDGDEPSLLSPD
ncbi:RmuC domain protein [Leptospira inadai serovar Lyme str. 10]|uniref:RmuC domain protein n=2 Tax=Leptospira inadai serovar Lyme TaxID=293084 RepID=V6HA93_9LEPT|nr:DNA recombination protein RmuC [Leptospira inadai]EQA36271.1 RmuC domain protein [Leptospira inadai serovar Lyme str. 10]PNV74469.1 DNA recombination protein RmuC [Leptospira inadai serovar Lyme]